MTRWNEQDLGAFQDGELTEADASRLAAALREDAGLRSRLAGISVADGLVLEAIGRFPPARPRRVRGWVVGVVLALLAGGPAAMLVRSRTEVTDPAVRVVLSVPVQGGSRATPLEVPTPEAATVPVEMAGNGESPAPLPVRSARTARVVLDGLSDAAQVEACERWAAEPHLRPVAFERLRELRRAGRAEVRQVAARMENDPGLRGWVSSYLPGAAGTDRIH